MLRWLEAAVAALLSFVILGLTLVAWASQSEGGAAAQGGAGGGLVVVADDQVAALVEEWTKPPVKQTAPKPPEAPGLAVAPQVDRTPSPEPVKKPEEKKPEKKKPAKKPTPAKSASVRGAAGKAAAKREASGRGARAASGLGRAAMASLVKSWGGRIRAEIARKRRYPSAARRNRTQGRVVLRLRVSRGGGLISATVARSSGARQLDQAALAAARAAAPFARAPSGLTAASYSFAIPITFKVR